MPHTEDGASKVRMYARMVGESSYPTWHVVTTQSGEMRTLLLNVPPPDPAVEWPIQVEIKAEVVTDEQD